ncbi:DNRLRE domain-containing protein [Nonomuraea sp. NPDC048881]|uniref:DNRLRE domain-containing protein n=1 Tax=Nonomuraea sp. NPDC048881 TaxID=3155030 RepID=UPI0033D3707B
MVDKVLEAAKEKASKSGKRVNIPERDTETTTLYANPDGKTLRMEMYLEPIRVKNANGDGFTPIDTTLVKADGVIRPKSAKGDLRLSAGGNTAAIKSKSGDITAQIDAPRTLPKPTLNGSTATYSSAYGKGIDLLVTATPTGFRQQIVIRERPAGPVTFRVPVDLPKGISFGENTKGQPTLKSADGKYSLDIRPAALLDAVAADGNADLGAVRVGRAQVRLDGSTLVYSPDPAFLADSATTYPVTMAAVDDDWYECTLGGAPCPAGDPMDTYINDVDLTDSWDMHYRDQMWVGKSYASSIAKRWRAYVQFPLPPASDPFWGSRIQNADLVLWNYLSNDCGLYVGSGITARQVTSDWDQLTLQWGDQPSVTNLGADTEYGAYSPDCSGSMNYEHDLIHSVNKIVQAWAGGEPNYGFQLTAGDESELRNWRRYRTREQTSGYPAHGPRLTVDFEPAERIRVVFETREDLATFPTYEQAVAWETWTPEETAAQPVSETQARALANHRYDEAGTGVTQLLPLEGESFEDPPEGDGEDGTPPRVISTSPAAESADVPLDATVSVTLSEETRGTELVVKDASGAVVSGSLSSSVAEPNGQTTVVFTPERPLSPGVRYNAEAKSGTDIWDNMMEPHSWSFTTVLKAAGHWTFDEGDGNTAADSSGQGHDATLTRGVQWVAGKRGNAVSNAPSQARIAASRAAIKQGRAVAVADETTATSITYAQPDGKTFTTEVTAGPVRIRQGNAWMPIDSTLVEQSGKLRPKAIAEGALVEISAGGSDAFVKMTADGKSYALRWPTPLPKPTVKGNVATYTDAAGVGADLVVTVLPTGFRHDVLLRQRPSKPLELRIGVEDDGLTLSEGSGGRLLLKGKGGKVMASAPQPLMWDGSAKGRLPLAKQAKVDTDVVTKDGRTELVLKPDHSFLSDPATIYPVRVDPTVTVTSSEDITVATTNTSPAYPSGTTMMTGVQTGEKLRSYLRFNTGNLSGQTVTDAKLSLFNMDSSACGTSVSDGLQIRRVTGPWNVNNLTWTNKPAATTEDAQINKAGYGVSCSSGPKPLEWNLTGIAQDWAAGAANHGLVVQSPTESTAINWRVLTASEDTDFNQPPTLTITTSGPASQPVVSNLAITPAQSVNGVTVTSSLTPQLAATVADSASGRLNGEFEIEHDPAATGQGSGQIWAGASPVVTSGGQATVSVPAGKLADGWKIRWRARAANATATTSAWSAWQTATVDVPNPTVGAFQVTPSQMVNGVTVTTSLTPALRTMVTDPAAQPLRAEFEVEHDPAATGQGTGQIWVGTVDNVASGTQASVTVPDGKLIDGWKVRWRARAVNTATTIGSPWSDWQTLTVDVPEPVSEPAVGTLQVTPSQQVDGTTVTPTLTPALLAQVSDPAGKPLRAEAEIEHDPAAPGGQGTGQIWTGSADNVPANTQANIVVPAGTLTDGWKVRWRARAVSTTAASAWSDWQSFTVSLPKPAATGLIITPASVVNGVTITDVLTPELKATVTNPDGQPLRAEFEIEHDPSATGQGTGQIWAQAVDGVASGTQASVTIPAGKLTDGWKIRWRVRAMAGSLSSPWAEWQHVTVDVRQPGEKPLADTGETVIQTNESFTVSAWLRWADKEGDYTVIEQRGIHQAPFRLGNTPDHGLVFTFTSSDAGDAAAEGVLSGVEPPVGEWFHLAGVYDATAKSVTLYLNGQPIKTEPLSFVPWHGVQGMTLGTRIIGDLDDVQVFQRVLPAADIAALHSGATSQSQEPSQAASQPLSQKEPAMVTSAATAGFNYHHTSLEACMQARRTSTLPYASFGWWENKNSDTPYSACWSKYIGVGEYSKDPLNPERVKPDVEDGFAVEVATVYHSYLGNSTGTNVVNGGTGDIKPRNIALWTRLQNIAVWENGDRVPQANLGNYRIGLKVESGGEAGSTCTMTSGSKERVSTVPQWQATSDNYFRFESRDTNLTDTDKTHMCAIAPYLKNTLADWDSDGEGDERDQTYGKFPIPLWPTGVFDSLGIDHGKYFGTAPVGGDKYMWKPTFRCDSWREGATDPEGVAALAAGNTYGIHEGGCVDPGDVPVFEMSKKEARDAGKPMDEVVDHIAAALNPQTNALTEPPLLKNGVRQPKNIPGNADAARNTPAGTVLTRTRDADLKKANRETFGAPVTIDGVRYPDGLCQVYFQYPGYTSYKQTGRQCDEYPFASTRQGASNANGHYSIRAVDGTQNRNHGFIWLNQFYSRNRVVNEHDPFLVRVMPE